MSSSDGTPGLMPPGRGDGATPPGKDMTIGQHMLDKGTLMLQSFKPINRLNLHICTFALYSHDMSRQIETHHFVSRINEDVCQCAVYDSDGPSARLIGIEYMITDKVFQTLPTDEQKLWHSHAYEVKAGLLVNPRVPGLIEKQELHNLAKTYGKFWCTWQVDRGDKLPLGAPALMVSPQSESSVSLEMVKKRDNKYGITSESEIPSRSDILTPHQFSICHADHWKKTGKGFAIDIRETEMKTTAPFP